MNADFPSNETVGDSVSCGGGVERRDDPSSNERARWVLAYRLDKRADLCWARLVGWVLDKRGVVRLRECRVDWACREDVARLGSCYCHKLGVGCNG